MKTLKEKIIDWLYKTYPKKDAELFEVVAMKILSLISDNLPKEEIIYAGDQMREMERKSIRNQTIQELKEKLK